MSKAYTLKALVSEYEAVVRVFECRDGKEKAIHICATAPEEMWHKISDLITEYNIPQEKVYVGRKG
jgi:hypothetical protein